MSKFTLLSKGKSKKHLVFEHKEPPYKNHPLYTPIQDLKQAYSNFAVECYKLGFVEFEAIERKDSINNVISSLLSASDLKTRRYELKSKYSSPLLRSEKETWLDDILSIEDKDALLVYIYNFLLVQTQDLWANFERSIDAATSLSRHNHLRTYLDIWIEHNMEHFINNNVYVYNSNPLHAEVLSKLRRVSSKRTKRAIIVEQGVSADNLGEVFTRYVTQNATYPIAPLLIPVIFQERCILLTFTPSAGVKQLQQAASIQYECSAFDPFFSLTQQELQSILFNAQININNTKVSLLNNSILQKSNNSTGQLTYALNIEQTSQPFSSMNLGKSIQYIADEIKCRCQTIITGKIISFTTDDGTMLEQYKQDFYSRTVLNNTFLPYKDKPASEILKDAKKEPTTRSTKPMSKAQSIETSFPTKPQLEAQYQSLETRFKELSEDSEEFSAFSSLKNDIVGPDLNYWTGKLIDNETIQDKTTSFKDRLRGILCDSLSVDSGQSKAVKTIKKQDTGAIKDLFDIDGDHITRIFIKSVLTQTNVLKELDKHTKKVLQNFELVRYIHTHKKSENHFVRALFNAHTHFLSNPKIRSKMSAKKPNYKAIFLKFEKALKNAVQDHPDFKDNKMAGTQLNVQIDSLCTRIKTVIKDKPKDDTQSLYSKNIEKFCEQLSFVLSSIFPMSVETLRPLTMEEVKSSRSLDQSTSGSERSLPLLENLQHDYSRQPGSQKKKKRERKQLISESPKSSSSEKVTSTPKVSLSNDASEPSHVSSLKPTTKLSASSDRKSTSSLNSRVMRSLSGSIQESSLPSQSSSLSSEDLPLFTKDTNKSRSSSRTSSSVSLSSSRSSSVSSEEPTSSSFAPLTYPLSTSAVPKHKKEDKTRQSKEELQTASGLKLSTYASYVARKKPDNVEDIYMSRRPSVLPSTQEKKTKLQPQQRLLNSKYAGIN